MKIVRFFKKVVESSSKNSYFIQCNFTSSDHGKSEITKRWQRSYNSPNCIVNRNTV